MQYISIHLYRKLFECAIVEGESANAWDDLPIPYSAVGEHQAVPADQFFALHERMDDMLGPGFALRAGQQMKIDDYGVLGLSWRTCSYAGEIFERSERYFKLLSNTYAFEVKENGGITTVYLKREATRRGLELSNEATLSATVVVLQATTEKDIRPVEVCFKHTAPANVAMYADAFQCPVRFGAAHYAIAYRTEDFQTSTAKADASINRFLLQRVEEETNGIEVASSTLVSDLEGLIREALPSGIPSIHRMSRHMGMSNRTLARRLSEAGISYRDLIKRIQKQTAIQMLQSTSMSMAEIAFQTGFSEQSAFNRAFKRWTGQTPIQFRNG
jgi:AraC-like DNA-binding protein